MRSVLRTPTQVRFWEGTCLDLLGVITPTGVFAGSPSESFTVASSSEIDKVMINLKTEEFVLDGPPLQSLQQLIQWVGDFVLYLLANLPNQASCSHT